MLKRNTGLYISYNNKGQIRKTIVTVKGETYTENSTIAKELLSFLNMHYKLYYLRFWKTSL